MNAVITWKVIDARKAVEKARDVGQGLYRESQLALRGIVGTRTLDAMLADKHAVISELESAMAKKLVEPVKAAYAKEVDGKGLPGTKTLAEWKKFAIK